MTADCKPATYAELVELATPALLRLALMLTGDPADAEDLLQTVLMRCLRHADRILSAAAPMAYLRKAVVNEHTSRGRAKSRRVHTVAASEVREEPISDSSADRIGRQDEVWSWLATLPRRQRAVLVLRFYEDLSDADIAAILGCSQGTVRSNAFRGLASLRVRIGEGGPE